MKQNNLALDSASIPPAPGGSEGARPRIDVLDSLRGIAALLVVVGHFLNLLPETPALTYSPLENAHSAVIFFFILSGFVLALPYTAGRGSHYSAYLIKRVFRIYIPYICAVAFAMLAYQLFSRGGIPELGSWFNSIWITPLSAKLLVDHLLLIGSFENHVYDPVLWSLVHEMRISVIFPFVCMLILPLGWRRSLGIGVAVSILGVGLGFLASGPLKWSSDYFDTLHYLFMFIIGMLLAKYRDPLVKAFMRLKRPGLLMLFGLGIVMFTYSKFIHVLLQHWRFAYLDDWFIAAGATLILLTALSSPDLTRALTIAPLRKLGEISYSLYLYHAIVLFSLAYLLHGVLPIALILAIAFVAAFAVSYAAWYWIEQPSITLGRRASRALEQRPTPALRAIA